ncbi:DNA topology modulation protein [Spirosoma terrae]|uniref:DNA topology modulation protein n=1 Tax=Spirosoma terrae TaxID=1968276 RepID=A0A6L9L4U3_9BACT|nr:DNA topology modulation protein [Spirosoma terrae]NDU93873.1 DNA topology modulation protein [Spirosoma terrae]
MKRIVILGSGGAGKSTLSRQLGHLLNLPVIHLDAILWQPSWVLVDKPTQQSLQQQLISQSEWIIDVNYGSTLPIRLAASDTVIFLDYSRWVCVWRAVKRIVSYYGRVRPDMAAGCPEHWDWLFIRWILLYAETHRPKVLAVINQYRAERQVFILKKPSDAKHFLQQLTSNHTHPA